MFMIHIVAVGSQTVFLIVITVSRHAFVRVDGFDVRHTLLRTVRRQVRGIWLPSVRSR